jgi:hypothetical protein
MKQYFPMPDGHDEISLMERIFGDFGDEVPIETFKEKYHARFKFLPRILSASEHALYGLWNDEFYPIEDEKLKNKKAVKSEELGKEISDKILSVCKEIRLIAAAGPLKKDGKLLNNKLNLIIVPEGECKFEKERYAKEGCAITQFIRSADYLHDNSGSFLCNCWELGILDDLFMGGNLGPGTSFYELITTAQPIYQNPQGAFEELLNVFSQQRMLEKPKEFYTGTRV